MSVEVLTTISPNTNEPIITRNGLSADDVEQLPKTAAEAFKTWGKTSLADRQAIVKKALKYLTDHTDELALEITTQMGRPIAYTGKEISTAVMRCEYLLKISNDTLKDTDGEPEKGFKRFIRKVPVGPVLILFPWNVSCSLSLILARAFLGNAYRVLSVVMSTVPIFDSGQLTRPRSSER